VKVRVDQERCQGHTLCAMIAPRAFQLDEIDGHSSEVSEAVPADQEEEVSEAAHTCPERAIVISSE
jgi:ferredoxin